MKFWKYFFGKNNNSNEIEVINWEKFRLWVRKSIQLIGSSVCAEMENEALHDFLIKKGIPEFEAGEIIIFLPTAFCRKLLPDLAWLENYYDYYSESKTIKRKYKNNNYFLIMEEETDKFWYQNPDKETVLNIAGRSAEFRVINKMLNDGGKLENVKFTESLVIRYE